MIPLRHGNQRRPQLFIVPGPRYDDRILAGLGRSGRGVAREGETSSGSDARGYNVKNFDYAAPGSLAEATALLAKANGTARMLAGGTDLLVQLREHLRDADLVVDVKKIPELIELTFSPEQGLRLGASVPCYRIYEHAEISAAYPALADAARIVGGWQIQSRASVGGNLCNSSPAADTIPPLIALQATCLIAGSAALARWPRKRSAPRRGGTCSSGASSWRASCFPPPAPHSGSAYERFIPRNEMDIAVVGAASWVQAEPGRGSDRGGANRPGGRRADARLRRRGEPVARRQARHRRDVRPRRRAGPQGRLADQRHAGHRRVPPSPGGRPHAPDAGQGRRAGSRLIAERYP